MITKYFRIWCFLLPLLLNPISATAQKVKEQNKLKEAKQTLEKLQKREKSILVQKNHIQKDIDNLRKKILKTSKKMGGFERKQDDLVEKITQLEQKRNLIRQNLLKNNKDLSHLLGALQKLSIVPKASLVLTKQNVNKNIRTAIALDSMIKHVSFRVDHIKASLNEIKQIQTQVVEEKIALQDTISVLETEREYIEIMLKKKSLLQDKNLTHVEETREKIKHLNDKVHDLEELLVNLQENKALNNRVITSISNQKLLSDSIVKSKGKLFFPVTGKIVENFGKNKENGLSSKGMVVQTSAKRQIIAPFSGRVVYSGPFRSYGNLLIIDHGQGYHMLLAGLKDMYAQIGNVVLAGEPVGIMGNSKKQKLYIEFRKDGKPINPTVWFANSHKNTQNG